MPNREKRLTTIGVRTNPDQPGCCQATRRSSKDEPDANWPMACFSVCKFVSTTRTISLGRVREPARCTSHLYLRREKRKSFIDLRVAWRGPKDPLLSSQLFRRNRSNPHANADPEPCAADPSTTRNQAHSSQATSSPGTRPNS